MRKSTFGIISATLLIGLLALFTLIALDRPDSSTPTASRLAILALPTTPIPDARVRLGASRELALNPRAQHASYANITPADVDGDLLIATGSDRAQGRTVLLIDLESGSVTRLTDFREPKLMHSLHISGDHVVWIEEEATSSSPAELHIANMSDSSETWLSRDDISQLDFQDGVVAWQGTLNQATGVYGYDLDASEPFVIDLSEHAHLPKLPRVCDDEWVVYLVSPTGALPHVAELWAYNRITNARIALGALPITLDPASAHQHACDGALVTWVARRFEQVDGMVDGKVQEYNELHLFDLDTRTARVIDADASATSEVLMEGDLILLRGFRNRGYDLVSGESFDANPADLPDQGAGIPVLLASDQLVWAVDPEVDAATEHPATLYITTVDRSR